MFDPFCCVAPKVFVPPPNIEEPVLLLLAPNAVVATAFPKVLEAPNNPLLADVLAVLFPNKEVPPPNALLL